MEADRARELLAQERARIERALDELTPDGEDDRSNVDQGIADAGTELYEKERDVGLTQRLRDELAAVERAEERLADGTFGRSVDSDEPIPDARLEVAPTAERTIEEQERYEQGAGPRS
jgi:DnaK suppressor protein